MSDSSSLFWKTTTTPKTKAEFEVWRSPEETGKRLVEHVTTCLKRSLDKLPAECRDWFRIDFERPYWIDPEVPQQALHELQRLTSKMPDALPDWWTLDREQQRAAELLMAVREAIYATHGMDPPRTLVLIERAIHLGFSLAQAHVEPWEVHAASGFKSYVGSKESHEMVHGTAEEKTKRWAELQAVLNAVVAEHPDWNITRCRKESAHRTGSSLSTIYRHTTAPDKSEK